MASKYEEKGLAPVWFKFFLDAGIPPADAGNYAVTFTENRIQPEMMTDLTKEYLAEMGITVLGDVIGILKHARVVHAQTAREKALKYTGLNHSTLSTTDGGGNVPEPPVTSALAQRSFPSSAMVPKLRLSAAAVPVAAAGVMPKANTKLHKQPTIVDTAAGSVTEASPTETMITAAVAAARRVPGSAKSTPPAVRHSAVDATIRKPVQPTVSTRKPAVQTSVSPAAAAPPAPVRPARLSSTEDKGAYKVVLPVGNTEKTRKLLSQQKLQEAAAKKSSIFDRLGSEVGGTTAAAAPAVLETAQVAATTFTVTLDGVGSPRTASTLAKSTGTSSTGKLSTIFSRLGGKTAVDETTDKMSSSSSLSTLGRKSLTNPTTTKKTLQDRLGPQRLENLAVKSVSSQHPQQQQRSNHSDGILGSARASSVTASTSTAKQRLGPIRSSMALEAAKPSPPPLPRTKIQLGSKRPSTGLANEPSAKVIRLGSAHTVANVEPPSSPKMIRLGATRISEPSLKVIRLGAACSSAPTLSRPLPAHLIAAAPASTKKPTLAVTAKLNTKLQLGGNQFGQPRSGLKIEVRQRGSAKDVKSRLGLPKSASAAGWSTGATAVAAAAASRPKIIRLKSSSSLGSTSQGGGVFRRLGNISTS